MSTIKIKTPPQTYSRLFRPWDSSMTISKCEDNKNLSDSSSSSFSSLSSSKSSFTLVNNTFKQLSSMDINSYNILENNLTPFSVTSDISSLPNYLSDVYSETIYGVTTPYNSYFPSGIPNPLVGIDPVTITLMEQEYARVIAEDAQTKAINARKQRPKKFKCPHCDVAFSNNGQLKGHVRIHTGEKPFKCDLESCGKTFTRNEELTRHKRIHTGVRPFGCTICGKKFGRRDHLKKHMKTHIPQDKQLGPAIFVPMYPYLYGC